MITNICVFGVGGVGGYFGGKIARAVTESNLPQRVHFVARGEHLAAIREHGLILNTDDAQGIVCTPASATDEPARLPRIDLALLCVKGYDLDAAIRRLTPLLGDDTLILPLLNGVDITERIRAVTKRGIVFPACVYLGTHIERPGVVTQKGGSCTIFFGPDPDHADVVPRAVSDLFDACGIKHKWLTDPFPAIWEKFLFIASFGLVGAAHDKTLGETMASPELLSSVRLIMAELATVAHSRNVSLAPDIAEASVKKGLSFPFEAKTSFQRDVEIPGKPDERDLFAAGMIAAGEALGLDMPETRRVSGLLPEKD